VNLREELKNRYKEIQKRKQEAVDAYLREHPKPSINASVGLLEHIPETPPPPEPIIIKEAVDRAVNIAVAEAQKQFTGFQYPALNPLPGFEGGVAGFGGRMALINAVADKYKIDRDLMFSQTKAEPIVRARHEAFYRLRTEKKLSYTQIGKIFYRDHSTVMHGVEKFYTNYVDKKHLNEPNKSVG
jgi:chromosomal replication initiator protein